MTTAVPSRKDLFPPKGNLSLRTEGQILFVDVKGCWNVEMHLEFEREIPPHVYKLNSQGPWASLTVFQDNIIFEPGVYERSRQFFANRPANLQIRAAAYVIDPGIEGYGLMLPRIRSIFRDVVPFNVLGTVAEGKNWLCECIAAPP